MRIPLTRTTLVLGVIASALLGATGSIVACGSDDDAAGAANGSCASPTDCDGGAGGDGSVALPDDKCDDTGPDPVPVTAHPRLFLTAADVPRLRSWAVPTNPVWQDGIAVAATAARQAMDSGKITGEDTGSAYSYTPYPAESYAMLFAFLSLVDADEATRTDDARRARTLLMHVIDKAALGVADAPYREERFSTSNRSRWWGEGFALTVDWIYGTLSADDKAKIRTVFLRWADENEDAAITTLNHPEPKGVKNDPALLAPDRVYWSGNNYYTAHMRNLALMSIALDDADDPGGTLHAHLESATGAWLYVVDALLRTGLRGGLAAEGFEYGPQAHGYVAQTLLALHTAGLDAPKRLGKQTKLTCNPHWDNSISAFLHSIGPAPAVSSDPNYTYLGPLYPVAWYGDGAKSNWTPDYIGVFGALGVYDQLTGNAARLAQIRWIEANTPPGGAAKLAARASARDFLIEPILTFMLFDPAAPAAPDPRPAFPLSYFDTGLGHLFARTSWGTDASWFSYQLGWSRIDHQHADGNLFQLWRKGEWLTKERSGYGLSIACTDYKNALALQNDAPDHNAPGDYGNIEWTRGSQWTYVNDGPGKIVAHALDPKYVYALGDATPLYQSTYEKATDVTHASRSIVWLPPDRVVVYDRAASKTAGRFKRFWLNLPAAANVAGRVMTMQTGKGQKLFVTSLLPGAATMTVEPAEALSGEPGELDPIKFRLRVEATGGPASARFLHVLKGADGSASADATSLVTSTGGTAYEGAAVAGVVVMFPVDIATPFASVTYAVPAGTVAQLVTGLVPGASYDVADNGGTVTVKPGGAAKADAGGVLVIGTLP